MDLDRYSRQVLFPPIGKQGQQKLASSSVLIVGVGALGTVICNHLVRAGIGHIRLVDRDYVEMSNIQRQMLFDEDDVIKSLPKAIAAKNKLEKINRKVKIEAIVDHVSPSNIDQFTENIDLVLDGTDNLSTRYLLNDICFKKGIPFSYGGVVASRGMTAFFIPEETPCFRCLMGSEADSGQTCDTVGVISPIVDIISSLQATEAMKYLTGNKESLVRSLRSFDIWFNQNYEIKYSTPKESCLTCQKKVYPSLQQNAEEIENVMCGRNTVQIHRQTKLDLNEWEEKLEKVATIKRTPFLLKANIHDQIYFVIFPDGRVLIQGTEDKVVARTWYDRYIGS